MRDLLRLRVRCDQGLDHGPGVAAWMHPPVHRLLGWVSRPSALGQRRLVWRLDQLCGLTETEALVQGEPAETDIDTILRLPTLIEASLLDRQRQPIGTLVDAAVVLRTGTIRHYLVSRSDPRLPGSSRWRLSPERIVDQRPGQVFTALEGLDDLPLAHASIRQELLRRSRRWRDQVQDERERLRERLQQAGQRWDARLEGWLEDEEEGYLEDRFRGPVAGPGARPSTGRDQSWGPDRPLEEESGPEPWDELWEPPGTAANETAANETAADETWEPEGWASERVAARRSDSGAMGPERLGTRAVASEAGEDLPRPRRRAPRYAAEREHPEDDPWI